VNSDWWIFRGQNIPHEGVSQLPPPPPWRDFQTPDQPEVPPGWRFTDFQRARSYQAADSTIEAVNAALYLRRPLLVTGKPGVGKSTLAYAVAHELQLGEVLRWPITSRSRLQDGLYSYDAIGRLHDANRSGADPAIGSYIKLGPLGTALAPSAVPRVLLVDELDKGDIDFPNDLLTVFEEGQYLIDELARASGEEPVATVRGADGTPAQITGGLVNCRSFPFVVLTSNAEREFPPAFLRRCIPLEIGLPTHDELEKVVADLLGPEMVNVAADLISTFEQRRKDGHLATDQLLNAVYLTFQAAQADGRSRPDFAELLMRQLQQMPS
jgi:MoxR-like ATPase